jgi:hypothetical protein
MFGKGGGMAAVDVVLRHASQIMLDHATEVAKLRQALEQAYLALERKQDTASAEQVVPGYREWRVARGEVAGP